MKVVLGRWQLFDRDGGKEVEIRIASCIFCAPEPRAEFPDGRRGGGS
jgi:hypothetical protein